MFHDVVIVGAGPVGLMLACELRLAGTPVVVLESGSEPGAQAPGVALNAGVVELLEMRGLMDACRAEGFEFPMAHFAHIWLDPTQLADRYPFNFAIPHSRLVHHLAELVRFPAVNEYLGMMVGGTDTRYPVEPAGGDAHPLAGRRLPGIAAAARSVPGLAEAWAAGHAVLLDLTGDDSLGRAVSGSAKRVTVLRSAPLPHVDAAAVLLRPDGRVAWAAPAGGDTAGLHAALTAVAGAPAQGS
ncbi:FAD-dependent monooxygenase [Micromonospora sp. DH15]|nr:FAD-dependent monooxygenase [Micromonospora sp. DH15]